MQGTWVRSLVQEDYTCCRTAKPLRLNSWAHAPWRPSATRRRRPAAGAPSRSSRGAEQPEIKMNKGKKENESCCEVQHLPLVWFEIPPDSKENHFLPSLTCTQSFHPLRSWTYFMCQESSYLGFIISYQRNFQGTMIFHEFWMSPGIEYCPGCIKLSLKLGWA